MDTVSFISDYIFIYLPVLMSVFCVATFLKLDSKIVQCFGIEQFSIADEITQDHVTDGEELVKREIQKKNRSGRSGPATSSDRYPKIPRPLSQEQLLPSEQRNVQGRNYLKINENLFDDI